MNDPYLPSPMIDPANPASVVPETPENTLAADPSSHRCGCSASHKIAKRTLMAVAITLIALNGVLYAAPQVGAKIAVWIPELPAFGPDAYSGHNRGCSCHNTVDETSPEIVQP